MTTMWRRVACLTIGIIFAIGLLTFSLAGKPPGRGEPGPRPFEWGDPDWPACSKLTVTQAEVCDNALTRGSIQPLERQGRGELESWSQTSLSSCFQIKGLGFEVKLRR